jgi:two-component system, chemotaxis family, protein-glutamate methylesterase/glutaminase
MTAQVVVIGTSAGGVEALKVVIGLLPRDFPAPLVVVLHLAEGGPSVLAQILDREGRLPVVSARHGDRLQPGQVYVGPPGHHVELEGETLRLSAGPRQDRHRPSIDRLFTTAAETLGARVVGVVLTGALRDGSAGLAAIYEHGGTALVQDPATAAYPDMPAHALAAVPAARVLPLEEVAAALVALCGGTALAAPG